MPWRTAFTPFFTRAAPAAWARMIWRASLTANASRVASGWETRHSAGKPVAFGWGVQAP